MIIIDQVFIDLKNFIQKFVKDFIIANLDLFCKLLHIKRRRVWYLELLKAILLLLNYVLYGPLNDRFKLSFTMLVL